LKTIHHISLILLNSIIDTFIFEVLHGKQGGVEWYSHLAVYANNAVSDLQKRSLDGSAYWKM